MLIHLTHNISPLIKLSFNTPKSTRNLDALSVRLLEEVKVAHRPSSWITTMSSKVSLQKNCNCYELKILNQRQSIPPMR
jgi:GDP-D-mannose dehydratase